MSAGALARAIAGLYRAAGTAPFAKMLGEAADALDAAGPLSSRPADAPTLSVLDHLDAALTAASAGPLAAVAAGFAPLARAHPWQQNPNYVAAPPTPGFLDRYGYCELLGPGRPWPHASLRVGLMLLAPGTLYPSHSHPASEVYHVVAGRSAWWRERGGWQMRDAGEAIHHAPNVPHATRAQAEPMLALYCWTGDIAAAARLTSTEIAP